jgi:hypothetical protein
MNGEGGKFLCSRLVTAHPALQAQYLEFPSGAFMIDLTVAGEPYMIESIGCEFGLSRQKTAVFGWEGVEERFESADALERRIRELVQPDNSPFPC